MFPNFGNIWLFNSNSEEGLVPLSLIECVLDGEWLLLVLGDWNLLGDDVWDGLDDGVVDSLGDFVWDGEVVLIWDLVVDSVWDLLSDNIWDLVGNNVWHLSAGGVWDLDLDFVWYLSGDGVRNLSGDFNWLKGIDFILFSDVVSSSDLVWNGVDINLWYLLGNLVLLGHVFGDSEGDGIIRRIRGCDSSAASKA